MHRLIALPFALLACLCLATVALAGGWAQVTASDVPADPVAGEETTIGLNVHQHGVTPVSWPSLTVIATDAGSNTVVRTRARAEGPEGSYVATIVFPSAGEWTLSFDSAELGMDGSVSMTVAQPEAAAQTNAAATAATFDALPLLLLGAATIALAIAGLVLKSRAAYVATRVSART
jgi:hypothetical protein